MLSATSWRVMQERATSHAACNLVSIYTRKSRKKERLLTSLSPLILFSLSINPELPCHVNHLDAGLLNNSSEQKEKVLIFRGKAHL